MQQRNQINPDDICQAAIQAKMNLYTAKENYDAVMKSYNDKNAQLVNVINLMKNKILELEEIIKEKDKKISDLESKLKEKETGKEQDKSKKS